MVAVWGGGRFNCYEFLLNLDKIQNKVCLVVEHVGFAPDKGEDAGAIRIEGTEGVSVQVEVSGHSILEPHLQPLPVPHMVSQSDILGDPMQLTEKAGIYTVYII